MLLTEAINLARKNETQNNTNCIIYKVYENQNLIYVGIGGKGKRKGSGRLTEHKSKSLYSSFRFQYYIDKWDKGFTRKDTDKMWEFLDWEIAQFNSIEKVGDIETQLIKTHNPIFNRDKK